MKTILTFIVLTTLFLVGCTPDATTTPTETDTADIASTFITYWLPSELSVDETSQEIGCGTYITPITTSEVATEDDAENVELALAALFSTSPQDPYQNYWIGNTVDNISIEGSELSVTISGDFSLIGTCGDASILAQILLTIFENSSVETASITVNGNNLKQISDMSGASGADAVFTEEDIPFTGN